ncbi:MAG: kynureninase [Pseudomonadota bacterium]
MTRDRFNLPDGIIYLDGNSLGAMPASVSARVAQTIEAEWGNDLITSWNRHDWIGLPQRLGAGIARLIGAQDDEVAVCDSTSVNLFKLLAAALDARPGRRIILTERGNFPTDLYIADGLARMVGAEVRAVPADAIASTLGDDVAVLMLTQVDYCSGRRHDMAALTAAAHRAGALALWDLSHSAGAIAVDLNGCDADLAVGCGYKYLNGGPGAPAFLYARRDLQDRLSNPLSGWMGHAAPFAFAADYAPAPGLKRFLTGTPSVIAIAALEAGLATFDGIEMAALEAESAKLSEAFVDAVEATCPALRLASPRDPAMRGSHVVLAHPDAYPIMQALIARGVIGDVREPELLRFGFAPLYNRIEEIGEAAAILADIMATWAFDRPEFRQRAEVI